MHSLIIFGAKYLFIALPILYLLAWLQANRKYKVELAVAFVVAGILAAIFDKVGAKLYYDPRPFVSHHLTPLVQHAADNGFPSEHTIFTITIATLLIFYRPKLGALAFLLGLLVGISRVAAHVHSPIDIIGGLLMGVVAGAAGYYLVSLSGWFKVVEKPRSKRRLNAVTAPGKQMPHQSDQRHD
jgi:undecaprenyl-diphosphatase